MNKHQAKTAAALLERMGHDAFITTVEVDGKIINYAVQRKADNDVWPFFNPYENDSDCWMVVDWMHDQGFEITLSNLIENPYTHKPDDLVYTTGCEIVAIKGARKLGFEWKDRRAAIIECAAEALGIEVKDDTD